MKNLAKFRARLERLERNVPTPPRKERHPFALDPTAVELLGPEMEAVSNLSKRERAKFGKPGDLSPTEFQDLARLRIELWERMQMIASSMAGYGVNDSRRDESLFQFFGRHGAPISADDEMQARVRIMFFALSPEGRARSRIDQLKHQYLFAWVTPAEREELARLEAAYPEVPWDTNIPFGLQREAWQRGRNESIEEIRLRHQQRAKTDPRFR